MKNLEDLFFAAIMLCFGIAIGALWVAPKLNATCTEPPMRVEYVVGKMECPVCGENLVLTLDNGKLHREVQVYERV